MSSSEYEIKTREGKVLFTASPDIYRDIVTQVLMSGRYVHTFEIFKEPRLEVTFRTISEKERIKFLASIKGIDDSTLEGSAKANLLQLINYTLQLNVGDSDIPITVDNPENAEKVLEKFMLLPSNVADTLLSYFNVFMVLVSKAFDRNDLLKN